MPSSGADADGSRLPAHCAGTTDSGARTGREARRVLARTDYRLSPLHLTSWRGLTRRPPRVGAPVRKVAEMSGRSVNPVITGLETVLRRVHAPLLDDRARNQDTRCAPVRRQSASIGWKRKWGNRYRASFMIC